MHRDRIRTPLKRHILYYYRMVPSERRAHAVQLSRSAAALARAGASVTLTIRRDSVPMPADAPLREAAGAAGVRIVPIRWRSRTRVPLELRLLLARLRAVGASGGRPVVFAREVAPYTVILARAACRWGLPFVYEAHNLKCVVLEEDKGVEAARPTEAMEREIFERASGIIFTAPLTENFARARFRFAAPVLFAPNGAPPVAEPLPGEPPARDIEILYAGQLYRWKGFDLLLRALALLPGRRLTVAGGGAAAATPGDPGEGDDGTSELDRARRLAEVLGVADRVNFLGQVAPGQALGLMRRARAGVIPLPAEGSAEARWFTAPLKLFELWATGAPVVVTDLPSLRALVRDGDTGLIAPAHPEGLAAALDRLLGDPTLAARLAGAGRAEAATRSWDARARTLLEFLDRHCR